MYIVDTYLTPKLIDIDYKFHVCSDGLGTMRLKLIFTKI